MAKFVLSHDAQDIDDTIDEVQEARGSEASLSARLADIVSDFKADQQRQETEIGVVAALGAENFLKVTGQTQTLNGVTFTVNSDQTVSLSGTASATATFVVSDNAAATRIPNGNYVLTGCPSGGGSTTYDIRWYLYSSGKSAYDQGSGASVNKTGNTTSSNIAILIRSGVNTDGLVFRPMISPAEITGRTYVPYAPTNRELYETCETKVTLQQVYGDAIQIPANSDLNSYTTPGLYYAVIANIPTIANTPYTSTGLRLVVEKNTLSGAAVFQTLYPTSRTHLEFYKRVYEGGNWSPWYIFEGTKVASAQSAASLMQAGRIDAAEQAAADPEEEADA